MHFSSFQTIILFLTTFIIPKVLAWGSLGHRTTTALALLYIPSRRSAHTLLSTLLHNQDPTTASLFPDRIRYIPSFAYTAPWHYIDAQDNPPYSCNINFTRDCSPSGGCVITAISNHTTRVSDTRLPLWQRGQSLRFMMHFFGDVHQPLHTENLSRGANEISVVFDGVRTNLHSVWDTLMPVKMAMMTEGDGQSSDGRDGSGGVRMPGQRKLRNETEAAYAWAEFLYARYGNDDSVAEKLDHVCVDDVVDCALSWAGEANRWVCEYVMKDGIEALQSRDLGDEYFEGATSIIEEMLVKGGRRLARWLMMTTERAHRGDRTDLLRAELVAELKR